MSRWCEIPTGSRTAICEVSSRLRTSPLSVQRANWRSLYGPLATLSRPTDHRTGASAVAVGCTLLEEQPVQILRGTVERSQSALLPPFVTVCATDGARCTADPQLRKVGPRLTAAGPDASRRRNLAFVILRGDRPLYRSATATQQRWAARGAERLLPAKATGSSRPVAGIQTIRQKQSKWYLHILHVLLIASQSMCLRL